MGNELDTVLGVSAVALPPKIAHRISKWVRMSSLQQSTEVFPFIFKNKWLANFRILTNINVITWQHFSQLARVLEPLNQQEVLTRWAWVRWNHFEHRHQWGRWAWTQQWAVLSWWNDLKRDDISMWSFEKDLHDSNGSKENN